MTHIWAPDLKAFRDVGMGAVEPVSFKSSWSVWDNPAYPR